MAVVCLGVGVQCFESLAGIAFTFCYLFCSAPVVRLQMNYGSVAGGLGGGQGGEGNRYFFQWAPFLRLGGFFAKTKQNPSLWRVKAFGNVLGLASFAAWTPGPPGRKGGCVTRISGPFLPVPHRERASERAPSAVGQAPRAASALLPSPGCPAADEGGSRKGRQSDGGPAAANVPKAPSAPVAAEAAWASSWALRAPREHEEASHSALGACSPSRRLARGSQQGLPSSPLAEPCLLLKRWGLPWERLRFRVRVGPGRAGLARSFTTLCWTDWGGEVIVIGLPRAQGRRAAFLRKRKAREVLNDLESLSKSGLISLSPPVTLPGRAMVACLGVHPRARASDREVLCKFTRQTSDGKGRPSKEPFPGQPAFCSACLPSALALALPEDASPPGLANNPSLRKTPGFPPSSPRQPDPLTWLHGSKAQWDGL